MNVCLNARLRLVAFFLIAGFATASGVAQKPALTLDEFFNSVSFDGVRLSPDGHSVVIGVQRADWEQNIFRRDLYLYHDAAQGEGTLRQLTQSGHDGDPQWSPDGRWIAFLSERKGSSGKSKSDPSGLTSRPTSPLWSMPDWRKRTGHSNGSKGPIRSAPPCWPTSNSIHDSPPCAATRASRISSGASGVRRNRGHEISDS